MDSRYIIYGLCDPRFSEGDPDYVFYIGKSHSGKTRPGSHATPSSLRQDDKQNWQKAARIRELIALFPTQGYTIKILEELPVPPKGASPEERLPHATALGMLERQYVRWARSIGWKILNLTDGGENLIGPFSGKRHTESSKQKMSLALKGENHHQFGKPQSESVKAKISSSLSGEKSPRFGKKNDPEMVALITSKNTGKKRSSETRKRLSESHIGIMTGENHPNFGKSPSDETRKKLSAAKKGDRHPFFGKNRSEETKLLMSEARKAWWAAKKAKAISGV